MNKQNIQHKLITTERQETTLEIKRVGRGKVLKRGKVSMQPLQINFSRKLILMLWEICLNQHESNISLKAKINLSVGHVVKITGKGVAHIRRMLGQILKPLRSSHSG